MATDYAKLEIRGVYSKNSDYSSPKADFNPANYTITPDEYFHVEIEADTGGTTLTTTTFASVTMVVVKNNDPTNYVLATFDCAGGGSQNQTIRVHAGGILAMTDYTPDQNLVLTANTAACECEVIIVGS